MKESGMTLRIVNYLIVIIGIAFIVLMPNSVQAQQKISAAVVAGLIQPFQEIAAAFEQETGIKIEATFSSAGRFYAQILNGAPYNIFISADVERPSLLYGKALCSKPFAFATGEVVLWSSKKDFCTAHDWRDALRQNKIKKIALANPKVAVYGASAQKALVEAGLWEDVEPRLVTTQDLAQVFQYAAMDAVDAGFCNLGQACSEKGRKGCYYSMKEAPVVVHSACVLTGARNRELTERFADYLSSPAAREIKRKYGYKETIQTK
ncbi:MAG TPA: molybdate ABC transporter substrate-binding protein [Syntrophaceae bacterium]|nr:molybdate ABC transporter substrate-binding protein [Syntrophaceae bacterium]